MIVVEVIGIGHDLRQLIAEINAASWDDANEMAEYDVVALKNYIDHQGTVFLACHEIANGERTLLGIASSRLEVKPYGGERWLYIDEVDVCANQRRRGAGTAMMKKLFEIAKAADCEEVWLATEATNLAADSLYRSLKPVDVADVVGYTYKLNG